MPLSVALKNAASNGAKQTAKWVFTRNLDRIRLAQCALRYQYDGSRFGLGGQIEAQIFDGDWALTDKRRVGTPQTYHALLNAIGDLVAWSKADQADVPIGIGAAGVLSADGRALTAFTCNKSQDCA